MLASLKPHTTIAAPYSAQTVESLAKKDTPWMFIELDLLISKTKNLKPIFNELLNVFWSKLFMKAESIKPSSSYMTTFSLSVVFMSFLLDFICVR